MNLLLTSSERRVTRGRDLRNEHDATYEETKLKSKQTMQKLNKNRDEKQYKEIARIVTPCPLQPKFQIIRVTPKVTQK